jgi:Leucine-rich repeat (LRR) protein
MDVVKQLESQPEVLNLSFKSLTGVPDAVWSATQLTKLVIAGNPITSLPPHVSNLTNLRHLHAGSTHLSHCPEEIAGLTRLTYLNLAETQLQEAPNGLGSLVCLNELLLSGTPITSLPSTLSNLAPTLTILKLGKCKLTAIPEPIGHLTLLKELFINDNRLTGPIPAFIYNLTALELLDLSNNKILSLLDDSIFDLSSEERDELFGGLSRLRTLVLNDNQFEQILPNTISNFTVLETLSLQYNRITSVPEDICKISSLRMLDVSVNKISAVPEEWSQLVNLYSLDISYNDISSIPSSYANFPSLKIFSVIGNNFDGLPAPCRALALQGCRIRYNQEDVLPNEILPRLYLGGVAAARDKYNLRRLGVTHILTVAEIDPIYPEEFSYKVVRIDDHADQDLGVFFTECIDFIEEGRDKGGVLVHCAAGISRSATIVTSYVMTTERLPMADALEFVKSKRSIICPNSGFRDQLLRYEDLVFKDEREGKCVVS